MAKSKIQKRKECLVCGTTYNLHDHHIFFGPNRKISEKTGMKVYLCAFHLNCSSNGVHNNREFDLELKKLAQRIFESDRSHEEFMQLFGKNYLKAA